MQLEQCSYKGCNKRPAYYIARAFVMWKYRLPRGAYGSPKYLGEELEIPDEDIVLVCKAHLDTWEYHYDEGEWVATQ